MDNRGAKKGINRFKVSVENKVSIRVNKIKQILHSLKSHNIAFDNVSALADYITTTFNSMIDIEEGFAVSAIKKGEGKINRTTLLRRSGKYRCLLDSYLIALNQNKPSESEALSLTEKLELVNLRNEVKVLNDFIDSNTNVDNQTSTVSIDNKSDSVALIGSQNNDNIDAIDACHKTIMLILEATEGLLILEKDSIVNAIRSGSARTVVGNELFLKTLIKSSQTLKGFIND